MIVSSEILARENGEEVPRRSEETDVVAKVEVPEIANEPYMEESPFTLSPPFPTEMAPPTFKLPIAEISLRTERLPASREWMMAEVVSRPPMSRMERESPLRFAT